MQSTPVPCGARYQTAAAVAAHHPLEVQTCDGVAEYDRLSPDYVPIEELKAENDPRYLAVIDGEWDSDDETSTSSELRVVNTIEELIDDHPGERIAVVCHGGVINSYLCHVLGLQHPRRLLLSQLHQHQPHRRGTRRAAIDRDHQRDLASSRHGVADGPLPGTVMADLDDLIAFLAASPSPWHVVSTAADRLVAAGFEPVELGAPWSDVPARGFVVRGAALVAWSRGVSATVPHSPLRLVGAHTDSPGLRDQAAARHRWRRVEATRCRGVRRCLDQLVARPRSRHRRSRRAGRRRRRSTSRSTRPSAEFRNWRSISTETSTNEV